MALYTQAVVELLDSESDDEFDAACIMAAQ